MHTRQRTREVGRDTDCAEGAGRGAAKGRAVSPVCRSGGRWRDRRTDAQQRPRWHSPFQPEGEKLWERETARDTRCQAVCVDETERRAPIRGQALQLTNAVALTRRRIQKFICFFFAYGKNTGRKSFAKVEVKVFGGPNVVICCVESERDPVHIASLEERKRWNSLDKSRC